jgi:ferredoxin-NADP reductase/MOSC domain-containing protein YiiM/ferredoxin
MNRLVSVNVGLPRDVQWQGKTVRTAVWKQPAAGRVMARRLNLDGDGQGDLQGHGGEHRAVMVYQLDSYRYWQNHFKATDSGYGLFGENFTVDGLADTEVCIGDRFRIGSAIFEVTQPRVTCYRVGIRTGHADMPALLVSHRRPGFYLRVLQEGEIGAGDDIVKITDGPERITVAEIDGLLYLPDHPHGALERALRIPALSPGWQGSLRALLAADEDRKTGNAGLTSAAAAPPQWAGFRTLKVVSSRQESDDVRSFCLGAPDGSPLPDALPGQYIVVKLRPSPDSPPLARNYSLSGPRDSGTYRISVKREAYGAASNYFHDHMAAGSTLEASAPRGTFTLVSGTAPTVLLSGGIGITPVLAMLHALTTETPAPRAVWWLHGARNGRRHAFTDETSKLLATLPTGRSFTAYSQPGADDRLGEQYDGAGRIDLPLLQRLGVPKEADFYLCGPAGFVEALTGALKLWGVTPARLHTEAFGPAAPLTPGIVGAEHQAPHLPVGEPGAGPSVTFTRSGLTLPWDARYNTLLEFAEACAVPVRWSCRAGVCHNCESALIDGQVRYSPEPLDPPAEGNVLICCSTPASEIQLDL